MPPRQQRATLTPETIQRIHKIYRPCVYGSGYRAVAAKLGISKGAVEKVIASGSSSQHLKKRRGRKRRLNQAEESKIKRRAISHPYETNKQLAARVDGKIRPRTVSDVLHRGNPEITLHRAVDQEPEELTVEWKQTVLRFIKNTLRRTRLDRRIYEDETPIYGNEAPRLGRAPKGKKLYRSRRRYARKYTLHVYAKKSGILYWDLRDKNANDSEIKTVASAAMLE
jgi:transposase